MANFKIMRNGLNTEIVGDPHIGQSSEDVTVEVTDDGTYSGYAKRLYYSYCYHNEVHRALCAVNSNNEFIIPVQAFYEHGLVKLTVELSNGTNCPACNACFLIVTDGAKDVDTSVLPSEKTWQSYIQSYIKSDVDALGKRIDNLILSSGSESSAEVIDARVGYDGTTYDTLGTAIRKQVSELKGDLSCVTYKNYKNLSEQENATGMDTGALNYSAGLFGKVESGKTYSFSAKLADDIVLTSNITIRCSASRTEYNNVILVPYYTINRNKGISVTFVAPSDGYITLSMASNADFIHKKILYDIQLELSPYATNYVKRGATEVKHRGYVTFEDFGAIPNDENADNSLALLSAIRYINEAGITLLIDAKRYYFKTPIVIDFQTNGLRILGHYGTSTEENRNSTIFNYAGEDTFITITDIQRWAVIDGIQLVNDGKNAIGVNANAILSRCDIKNISFKGFTNQLILLGFAYTSFTNCSFSGKSADTSVRIGQRQGNLTCEYLMFNFCNFEGGVIDTTQDASGGIEINNGIHITFSDCDFCNHGNSFGVKILPYIQHVFYVFFRNCNFARSGTSLLLDCSRFNIGAIYVDGCVFTITGTNPNELAIGENVIEGKTSEYKLIFKAFFKAMTSENLPEYIVKLTRDNGRGTHKILDETPSFNYLANKAIN